MNRGGLLGGRYEVRDVLGFGATAEVRDGWDTRLNRPVAIKLLHRGLCSQAGIRLRFEIEARAAAALNHRNIVRVYDIGDHDETPFIVMERLPGDTLGDQIALGPLPQAQVYTALRSVLAALAAAHDAGMLHRDIKPSNILLAPPGSMKVADFGIVKSASSVHTTTGNIVGTLAYLSPGRVAGKPASVGDDLYAAGVVGYEALTGRMPFAQADIMPLAHAILEGQPPPVTKLRPDADPGLAEVIERAMSQDPLRRFSSADEMRGALTGKRIQHVDAIPAGSFERPPTVRNARPHAVPDAIAVSLAAVHRSPKRTPKVVGSAALLGAMAITVLAFSLAPSSTTAPPTEPGTFSTSTPVPSPIGVSAVPSAVQADPAPHATVTVVVPPPSSVVEQVTERGPRGSGSGNTGNSVGNNGNGNTEYGNGNNANGARADQSADGTDKSSNGSANGNGKGNGNGSNGNGKPK